MEFSEYIAKQNQLIGKVEAYIEVKEFATSKQRGHLDEMIKNIFLERDLIKLEYENTERRKRIAELENTLLEHNERH